MLREKALKNPIFPKNDTNQIRSYVEKSPEKKSEMTHLQIWKDIGINLSQSYPSSFLFCSCKRLFFCRPVTKKNIFVRRDIWPVPGTDGRYINVSAGNLRHVVYDESKMTSSTARPGLTAFLDWIQQQNTTPRHILCPMFPMSLWSWPPGHTFSS